MTTLTGVARRRLLMPGPEEVTFAKRGFEASSPVAQRLLERSAEEFRTGLHHGLGGSGTGQLHRALSGVERPFRGFAHEGAAMGLAVTDALTPGRGGRLADFAAGPALDHIYMVHVGSGWAMARLPRALWWRAVLPDRLLRWLALDGYGFHQAYFATERYVLEGRPLAPRPPWPDPSGYAARAVDAGIGRALWFVLGADAERLAARIGAFDPRRRADLWAGAGLAATYAGGVNGTDLDRLVKLAAGYRAPLAQGSAFAAQARLRADLVTPHTVEAVRVLCESTLEPAAELTQTTLLDLPAQDAPIPAFALWRQRIQSRFVGLED